MSGYWFDWRRDAARRAIRHRRRQRQYEQERRWRIDAIIALTAVAGLLLALCAGLAFTAHGSAANAAVGSMGRADVTIADFTDMSMLASQVDPQCEARYQWPLADPQVEQPFDRPISPWAPGHRGVDLTLQPGAQSETVILAPQEATVSFAGKVAGKDVISVRHRGGITSTFEPATTTLPVGTTVPRGQPIGTVGGESDHCESRCLHWGLKRGADDYLDPQRYTGNRKIVIKPL